MKTFFVSFVSFVFAFSSPASAQGKKVYISVDLEGISGGAAEGMDAWHSWRGGEARHQHARRRR